MSLQLSYLTEQTRKLLKCTPNRVETLKISNTSHDQQYYSLSQPNNYHDPNNKTTITVVGLRQSNRWEPPPPPTTGTQDYMKEQK